MTDKIKVESRSPQRCSGSREAGIPLFLLPNHLWVRSFSGDFCLSVNMQSGPVPREAPFGKVIGFGISKQNCIPFWKKSYATNVSKRTYFQTRLLCGFRLSQRLNFMRMLQNMTIYSYRSPACKYSIYSDRSGLCPPYIFSPIDTFRKKAEGIFPLFCLPCSLPKVSGSLTYWD